MPNDQAFAARLRKARERLSETQAEFATRVGVNQGTISRWETHGPRRGLGRVLVQKILDDIERVYPIESKA